MFELQGYDKFHQLRKLDYRPSNLGFGANVKTGDIVRFASRIRLAKSFRGIKVEGYSQETVSGYDAFFIVFLTVETSHGASLQRLQSGKIVSALTVLNSLFSVSYEMSNYFYRSRLRKHTATVKSSELEE